MSESKQVSLYNITEEMQRIDAEIALNNGEISDNQNDLLEALESQLTLKTDNVVQWVNSVQDKIIACNAELERITKIKKDLSNGLEKFNSYIITCMDRMETVKLEGDLRTISLRKPSKKVEIFREDDIPIEYINTRTTTVTSIDKNVLKKKLKEGFNIPGARLIDGTRSLTIK